MSATAFERLLDALDEDRERAALEYERLRQRITSLLTWWGAVPASDLADQTLDRVARKLEEGAEIRAGALPAYIRGVARMVFHESTRRPRHETLVDDVAAPPSEERRHATLSCLDRCLDELSTEERSCLLRYYDDGGERTIDRRRELAAELGTSMNLLRVRTHRLRQRVERCVGSCLRSPVMDRPFSSSLVET